MPFAPSRKEEVVEGLTNRSENMSDTTSVQGKLYRALGSTEKKVSVIGIGG